MLSDLVSSLWSVTFFFFSQTSRTEAFFFFFLKVKDGLKILHLWLAKREIEERHIKNKSFAGIDLTELDLIERNK